MKLFWEDRYGRPPPKHSTFSCLPFFPDGPSLSLQEAARISDLPPPTVPIRVNKRTLLPDRNLWCKRVEQTTEAINRGKFQKAVLARACIFECETPPEPFAILAKLKETNCNATLFCIANDEMAFLGATPEILFSRKGREVSVDAMAGTAPLHLVEEEFLADPKPNREILPVQTFLTKRLSPFCSLTFSPITVRKTKNLQHLYSEGKGILEKDASDEQILYHLHPTPALCGIPQESAFEWIREQEPFPRDLYGGIIGWKTPEESMWAVSIRSCLIRKNIVTLYTGAGIVEGSDPIQEWEELNTKMNLYREIFI